jgi:hypothetical protein
MYLSASFAEFHKLHFYRIASISGKIISEPVHKCNHKPIYQSWAFATFATFFPFRYSLIRYFNVAIRYRYSATFKKFAIRYSLFATSFELFKFYAGFWIRIDFNLDPVPALDFWGF